MWIFTSQGFISAVAHREQASNLMVRARRIEHLQAIFPGHVVTQLTTADYKYRVTIDRAVLAGVMLHEIESLTYQNFKSSIADHQYHDACMGVWRVMHKLQPGSYMPEYPDMFDDPPWDDEPPEQDSQSCHDCGESGIIRTDGDITWCTGCGQPI